MQSRKPVLGIGANYTKKPCSRVAELEKSYQQLGYATNSRGLRYEFKGLRYEFKGLRYELYLSSSIT